ncbi:MAG: bifunctional (p)ppGpp synthetase/guanosine-3',5'-bis(diphosphate) 3'-pyrophosphohydrolase [bacterium]
MDMVQAAESPVLKKWLKDVEGVNRRVDVDYLSHAYRFSEQAHREQQRKSGEVYLTHPMAVALELARLHLDTSTVAAGLLHDVLEDTQLTKQQLTEEFGPDVAFLVEGVTKISGLEFRSKEEAQAENFRKMLLSMAQDLRVILIKLADRLHNMQTLEHLDKKKADRIANETLGIYAPLAHRFGIYRIKTELEDLALSILHPEEYESLAAELEADKRLRIKAMNEVRRPVRAELKKAGIQAEITHRLKSYYSIWNKMQKQGVDVSGIYDIMALRIIASDRRACYHALGVVHSLYVPISHRFKDFIANPKSNGYQSIHTTVVGPAGEPVEIQIRTREMHRIAEEGIAAHWKYKEGRSDVKPDEWDHHMQWVRDVIERQTEAPDAEEFMEHLRLELFESEVYVFTPQGDVIRLPGEATALDFAFAVHTDVGLHCQGAKVDGRIVSLDTKLKSGNTVEILTAPHQHPSQGWLRMVKTSKARSAIKRYLREQQAEQSVKLGKELLERDLRKVRRKMPSGEELTNLAQSFGYEDAEGLLEALGRGTRSSAQIIEKLVPEEDQEEEEEEKKKEDEGFLQRLVDRARSTVQGVSVQGEGNMMIHFAQCCQPIPGDEIIGYITRGRGVSIHRKDCLNMVQMLNDPERLVEVSWDSQKDQAFMVGVSVTARDRVNLLGDISRAISSHGTNIRSVSMSTETEDAHGRFILEVRNLQHLQKILKRIRKVKGVERVERLSGTPDL